MSPKPVRLSKPQVKNMRRMLAAALSLLEGTLIAFGFIALVGAIFVVVRDRRLRVATEDSESPILADLVKDTSGLKAYGYAWGPATATHTLVVFEDFQCPGCRAFAARVDTLIDDHPELRIIERHWPLTSLHPYAFKAALAAECGKQAGAYALIRRSLYGRPGLIDAEEWGLLARTAGIKDTAAFASCVKTERFRTNVERDTKFAVANGFRGTPTVILNSRVFETSPSVEDIEREIKKQP